MGNLLYIGAFRNTQKTAKSLISRDTNKTSYKKKVHILDVSRLANLPTSKRLIYYQAKLFYKNLFAIYNIDALLGVLYLAAL